MDLPAFETELAELIRVRGLMQGVGFRPTVWRLANRYGLRGWVGNDGGGVTVSISGRLGDIEGFVEELRRAPPPLARIDAIERVRVPMPPDEVAFRIADSEASEVHTGVVPDAAICTACQAEIADPAARRYRYPFCELHALRPASVDHRGDSVRSREHHDARVSHVRGVRGGVRRSHGPAVPRATDCLSGLRAPGLAGAGGSGRCDRSGTGIAVGRADCGRQGAWRVSPSL